jgi:hypothetical protein
MMTGEKRTARRRLAVWLVLSIILMLVGLWRVPGPSAEGGAASSHDDYPPPRLDLSSGEAAGSARRSSATPAKNYQDALRGRQLGRLEERWRGEAEGEGWTRETASWIEGELRRKEIPGRLERPDCRQSLCRLRVVFDDPGEAGKIYAVQLVPRTNWYTDFRVEGGQMVVTAYLGAPGDNLRQIINDPFAR